MIADLGQVEVVSHARTDRQDQRLDLGVLEHLVDPGLLDIQDLASDGQDCLGTGVPGVLGGAERRKALDYEQLRLAWVSGRTVDELARKSGSVQSVLAPSEVAGLAGGDTGALGEQGLLHYLARPLSGSPPSIRRACRSSPSRQATGWTRCQASPWSDLRTEDWSSSQTQSR